MVNFRQFLTFLLGILIGFCPLASHGLECYNCTHSILKDPGGLTTGNVPAEGTPKENPKCIDPEKDSADSAPCSAGDVCIKAYGKGHMEHVSDAEVLLRGCFPPDPRLPNKTGCYEYDGKFFIGSGTLGPNKAVQKARGGDARDYTPPPYKYFVPMMGKYCVCETDKCNKEAGMEIADAVIPIPTTLAPDTEPTTLESNRQLLKSSATQGAVPLTFTVLSTAFIALGGWVYQLSDNRPVIYDIIYGRSL